MNFFITEFEAQLQNPYEGGKVKSKNSKVKIKKAKFKNQSPEHAFHFSLFTFEFYLFNFYSFRLEDFRTFSSEGKILFSNLAGGRLVSMSLMRSSAAARPISKAGWRMVLSSG